MMIFWRIKCFLKMQLDVFDYQTLLIMLTSGFCEGRTAVKRGAGLGFRNLLMIDDFSDVSIRGTVIS